MWVTRQDELVQPELVVLKDALCHLLVAPDEGSAGTRAYEADTGPQVGAHLEVVTASVVERAHALLPHGFTLLEKLLRGLDEDGIHRVEQTSGLGPRLMLGVAGDHVEAHAEADGPTLCRRLLPDPLDPLPSHLRGLPPQEVNVDIPGGNVLGDARCPSEEDLGDRVGGRQGRSTPDLVVPALEVEGRSAPRPPENFQELVRSGVALVMGEPVAESPLLERISAGHDVDQEAALGQPLEGGGLLGGKCGIGDARPEGNEESEPGGVLAQDGGHQPGVLAPSPRRGQDAVESEVVGGAGDLCQVVDRGRATVSAHSGHHVAAVT